MKNKVYPCLWFDNQAQEVATFYTEVFGASKMLSDNGMVINMRIFDQKLMLLNGGPMFKINPSISFFIFLKDADAVNTHWDKLSGDGKIMMKLDTYAWSERYGWCTDKFGVNWQIMVARDGNEAIVPALMFTQDVAGKAEAAIQFYTSLFPQSEIGYLSRYTEGQGDTPGYINHGNFILCGQRFIGFDSSYSHGYGFDEGISLVISCDDQQEIDYYWQKLTDGGQESQCGWLKDKFGLSWQVVPAVLDSLMMDPLKAPSVVKAFLQMKKFDIQTLIDASES